MALQFDPTPYLAAFKAKQEQTPTGAQIGQQIGQSIGDIGNTLMDVQNQGRNRQLQNLQMALQAGGQGYDPNAWLSYLNGPTSSQSPSQPSPGTMTQPQPFHGQTPQMPWPSQPSQPGMGQMASAGASGMGTPPTPQPSPTPGGSPAPITKNPIIDAWNRSRGQGMPSAPQGPQGLFAKKPFDINQVLTQLQGGDASALSNLNDKQMKQLEATPAYIQMKKKEGAMPVDEAAALLNLDDKHAEKLKKVYGNGLIPQDKWIMLSSGVKMDATMGTRNDQFNQKEWDKIVEKHNPDVATQRSSIGISARLINSADRALETLNDRSHPLTYQDLGNVQQDIASIYQNGSPTDSAMKHNEYNTIFGAMQKTLQSLSGNPQDAVPEAIRKQLIDRLNLLKGTSYNVINRDMDTVETSQRRIIANRSDEWKGMREKWKNQSGVNSSGNKTGAATHRWNPQTGQVEAIQ